MFEIDNKVAEHVLCSFIREYVHRNGFKRTILGVSGGLDSAIVVSLCARALGAENVDALLMPYKLSSSESLEDGEKICKQLNVKYEVVEITDSVDAYFSKYPPEHPMQIGNKCARERMSVLYDFSDRKRALVAGTSNKSELLIGYSTVFGDSAAAYMPIGDLYKTQIFSFAEYLGVPESIVKKQPSADLFENQTDESEIGFTYRKLDEILMSYVDYRMTPEQIVKSGYAEEDVNKIIRLIVNSQYKRSMPSVAKLQNRTIGIDFRVPRDWMR